MLEVVSVALLYNTVEVVPFVDTHYKLPNKHKDYPIHACTAHRSSVRTAESIVWAHCANYFCGFAIVVNFRIFRR